jgi:thioredoxin-like negative regulator of GroEL
VEGPVAFAVGILGRVAYEEGDLDEAQQLLEDALRREELLRGATGGAHAAGPLVDLLIERGELDRAEAVLEQWVSDSRRRRLMGALYAIFQSDLALCRGDVERADTWLREVADSSATAEVIVAVGLRTARLELERDPALAATLLRAVRALEEDGQPLQRREQVIRDAVAARLPVVESGAAELGMEEIAALLLPRSSRGQGPEPLTS